MARIRLLWLFIFSSIFAVCMSKGFQFHSLDECRSADVIESSQLERHAHSIIMTMSESAKCLCSMFSPKLLTNAAFGQFGAI